MSTAPKARDPRPEPAPTPGGSAAGVAEGPEKGSTGRLAAIPGGVGFAGRRLILLWAYVTAALLGSALVVGSTLRGDGPAAGWTVITADAVGVLIISLVALQFVLSSRFRWIERPWGLDRLLRFHRRMGLVLGILVLTHPSVLGLALAGLKNAEQSNLYRNFQEEGVWLGALAAGLVLLQLLTTHYAEELFSYERWRAFHKLAVVIVLVGFFHAWEMGVGVGALEAPALVVAAWLAIALMTIIYTTFVRPGRLPRYRVIEVTQETHDTWTLRMAPPEGEVFDYLPGQFMFLTLYRKGFEPEEHPFTISSSPTERRWVSVTPKNIGDFTATIKDTEPGDVARIEAPYGRLTYLGDAHRPLLFITGGIGITPIASYLRHIRDTKAAVDVVFIDANRTEGDIVFRRELDALAAAHEGIRIIHVLSEPDHDWDGPTGYVDEQLIRKHVPDLAERVVFLCGPPPMMKTVRKALAALGLPPARIHYEEFRLR